MDETKVDFDMVSSYTLNDRGARSISVKRIGSSQWCTVMLAVTASGYKLPALCIFKGVPNSNPGRSRITAQFSNPALNYPHDMVYVVQEKAWNDRNHAQSGLSWFGTRSVRQETSLLILLSRTLVCT